MNIGLNRSIGRFEYFDASLSRNELRDHGVIQDRDTDEEHWPEVDIYIPGHIYDDSS